MKKVLALALSILLLCSVLSLQVFAREIKDFQFLPCKTLYYQGVDGHYDEENPDRFVFDIHFMPGDVVRLTDFDNLNTDYTCVRNPQTGELEFLAESGDVILVDELHIYTEQEDGGDWRYTDGEENLHSFTVVLEGNEADAQIRVARNPVNYISYNPNGEQHRMFERDGEWRTDEQGTPYFHYALQFVREGDCLCVGTDGYEYYYDAVWSAEQQQFYFQPTEEGAEPLYIGPGGIEYEDNQAQQPFAVGADNYYTVRYMGQSYDIQVVIEAAGGASILGAVNAGEIYHALTVALYEGETQVQQQELSSSETFRFDNLHPGTYTIQISGICVPTVTLTGLMITENSQLNLLESDNEQLRMLHIAEGDANGDGWIDIGDITSILTDGVFGSTTGDNSYRAAKDVNADGVIDIDDIAVLLQVGNYGAGAKSLAY